MVSSSFAIFSRLASYQAWATHSSVLVVKAGFHSDQYVTDYKEVTAHP